MELVPDTRLKPRVSRIRSPRLRWRLQLGLWGLIFLALPPPLAAQETAWYKIEMILFVELEPGAGSAQYWPEDPGQPEMQDAIPLAVGSERVQSLPPSAYRLSGIWSALKRSRNYRPLRHLAWQQPGLPARGAPLVAIGDELDAEIRGTVKVSRSRFLHLELDLVLQEGDQRFRFQASRRMRSNELHYLDSPKLSAVVIITPRTE